MQDSSRQLRRKVRVAVDVALGALFVGVMATALVQEAPHEYLGIATFAALVAHIALNRMWFKALLRGRYRALRVLKTVTIVGLGACAVGLVASSLVLSKFAFGFLPALPGAAWARRVHMLCSYRGFVLAFAHAGLQLKGLGRLAGAKDTTTGASVWLVRVVAAAISCYGVYAFVKLNMASYLLGQIDFAFADYSAPLALSIARYAAIAASVTCAFHCLGSIVSKMGGRRAGASNKGSNGASR